MFTPWAKVIADSCHANSRVTTIEVSFHRFVLAEMNTHRDFSRNSASSRAIPYSKMRAKALEQTAYPVGWPAEQKGMQGGTQINERSSQAAVAVWSNAVEAAVAYADQLHGIGVHKSVVNRLLEPFIPHTAIISSTNWDNFWAQRCHEDAQPEIKVAAEAMRAAYNASTPVPLQVGEWHLPYITDSEHQDGSIDPIDLQKISVARCARVSYLTHDGVRDLDKDIELFDRLVSHVPAHASPLEHVATPATYYEPTRGNFRGWHQLRHTLGL